MRVGCQSGRRHLAVAHSCCINDAYGIPKVSHMVSPELPQRPIPRSNILEAISQSDAIDEISKASEIRAAFGRLLGKQPSMHAGKRSALTNPLHPQAA